MFRGNARHNVVLYIHINANLRLTFRRSWEMKVISKEECMIFDLIGLDEINMCTGCEMTEIFSEWKESIVKVFR